MVRGIIIELKSDIVSPIAVNSSCAENKSNSVYFLVGENEFRDVLDVMAPTS